MLYSKNFFMIFAFTLLYFFFSSNAIAQLYSYTDESGVIHYTDNYSNVPNQFKNQVDISREIKPDFYKNSEPVAENFEQKEESEGQQAVSLLKNEADELVKRKKALESEYKSLLENQKELEILRQKVRTKKQKNEYLEKFESVNAMIKNYEDKRVQYQKDLDAYNKKVSEQKIK